MSVMKMWANCGLLVGIIVMVVTAVAGCTASGVAGSGAGSGTLPYASVAELAHALRKQQVKDGTMLFETKLVSSGAPGRSTGGSGMVRVGDTETDFEQSLDGSSASGDEGASAIVLGTTGFSKSGASESPSPWSKAEFHSLTNGISLLDVFTTNMLYLTQLDGSSEAFTLVGSAAVLGSDGETEYRLTADEAAASELAFRHAGIVVDSTKQATPGQMGLNLTIDGSARLRSAHWQLSSKGDVVNIDYVFSKWGTPVDIAAPAVK